MLLAQALVDARGEDDNLIAALAAEGDAGLLAALCGVRAGIAPESAWMLLVNDGARDAMLLARLAGLQGPPRRRWSRRWPSRCCGASRAPSIGWFDQLTAADMDAARRWWRLPAAYRDAFDQGGAHGHALD